LKDIAITITFVQITSITRELISGNIVIFMIATLMSWISLIICLARSIFNIFIFTWHAWSIGIRRSVEIILLTLTCQSRVFYLLFLSRRRLAFLWILGNNILIVVVFFDFNQLLRSFLKAKSMLRNMIYLLVIAVKDCHFFFGGILVFQFSLVKLEGMEILIEFSLGIVLFCFLKSFEGIIRLLLLILLFLIGLAAWFKTMIFFFRILHFFILFLILFLLCLFFLLL